MAPAPALAAFFFFDAIALLASAWSANHTRTGEACNPSRSAAPRRRALALGPPHGGRAARGPGLGLERLAQDPIDVVGEHELDVVQQVLRHLVEVRLVQLRRDDARDAGALRRERLLLQAADRQHL